MIKFLKKLFGKTELVKKPLFTPSNEIEEFLINNGFKFLEGELCYTKDDNEVRFNLKSQVLTIYRQGGNIILNPYDRVDKVKRFLSKYII